MNLNEWFDIDNEIKVMFCEGDTNRPLKCFVKTINKSSTLKRLIFNFVGNKISTQESIVISLTEEGIITQFVFNQLSLIKTKSKHELPLQIAIESSNNFQVLLNSTLLCNLKVPNIPEGLT